MKNLVARAGATVTTLRRIHVRSIGEVDGGKPRGEYVEIHVDMAGKKRGRLCGAGCSALSIIARRMPGSQATSWVLAAVLQFAHLSTGFRNRELRTYPQNRFGLSPDDYTAARLRYDLVKLRAKGWISKLEGSTRYVLTRKGMSLVALRMRNRRLNMLVL
jgi:hypothetical protein